jgi:hypothetical protein
MRVSDMLKMYANGKDEGGKKVRLVMLGLSHANLDELRKGCPIRFNGSAAGLEDDIYFMIFAGESEWKMQREILDSVGPETAIHVDPRLMD